MTQRVTGANPMPLFEEELSQVREQFPQVAAEYERLEKWVRTCLGVQVADFGGPEV